MKIREVIVEHGGTEPVHPDHKGAIKNMVTYPGQNPSTGSSYLNYRFGIALAGAPDYPTRADNYIAGDPLLAPYTEAEMEIINYASQQVGDGSKQTWSNGRSQEMDNVLKVSPVAPKKKNQYGV